MGYYYKLTWPAAPDLTSVAVTGNFDDWALSEKGVLSRSSDADQYETTIYLEEKHKIVFKFVVNGCIWTTNDTYKVEFDEHGNKNNYVDADVLNEVIVEVAQAEEIPDIQISTSPSERFSQELREENDSAQSKETDSNALHSDDANEAETSSDDAISNESSETEVSHSSDTDHGIRPPHFEAPTSASSSNVTDSKTYGAQDSEGEKPDHGEIKDVSNNSKSSISTSNDTENASLAESSYTEVSFITSRTHNVIVPDTSSDDERSELVSGLSGTPEDSASTEIRGSGGSSNYEESANQVSSSSTNSDYISEEENAESVTESPTAIDQRNDGHFGLFSRIKRLFRPR
ncbi:hypothetical protein OXX59_005311 [Metschnikowia pulcherrima]